MIYVVLVIAGLVVTYAVGLPLGGLAVGITKLALNPHPTAAKKSPEALAPLRG